MKKIFGIILLLILSLSACKNDSASPTTITVKETVIVTVVVPCSPSITPTATISETVTPSPTITQTATPVVHAVKYELYYSQLNALSGTTYVSYTNAALAEVADFALSAANGWAYNAPVWEYSFTAPSGQLVNLSMYENDYYFGGGEGSVFFRIRIYLDGTLWKEASDYKIAPFGMMTSCYTSLSEYLP